MYEVRLRKRANLIWEVELKDETSQTHQFGHTKQIQELFPDKTASRLGLSYEGSSKKRKNAIYVNSFVNIRQIANITLGKKL